MSRVNRVNPSMYTQAGRLTPDDAAREYAKQRAASGRQSTDSRDHREPWRHQAEKARERIETSAHTDVEAGEASATAARTTQALTFAFACALGALALAFVGLRQAARVRRVSGSGDQPF